MSCPSIYLLRREEDEIPKRETLAVGDIVILKSGDILVCLDGMWDLLPGRYLEVEQLKEFILYIRSGWPSEVEVLKGDMAGRVSDQFLSRMIQTVERLNSIAKVEVEEQVEED